MKNPFGKTRDKTKPYAIYQGADGFIWRILKTYRMPEKETGAMDRWFLAATSDFIGDSWEYGDTYKQEVLRHGQLIAAEPEWIELQARPFEKKARVLDGNIVPLD